MIKTGVDLAARAAPAVAAAADHFDIGKAAGGPAEMISR